MVIRLEAPPFTPTRPDPKGGLTLEQQQTILDDSDARLTAAMKTAIDPAVQKLADLLGIEPEDIKTNEIGPRLYAKLTPNLIKEVETWNEVKRIALDEIMAFNIRFSIGPTFPERTLELGYRCPPMW